LLPANSEQHYPIKSRKINLYLLANLSTVVEWLILTAHFMNYFEIWYSNSENDQELEHQADFSLWCDAVCFSLGLTPLFGVLYLVVGLPS